MVDVGGVYFPGWLVSTVGGVVVSYGVVSWLGRGERTRQLADSGLFFVGLIAAGALMVYQQKLIEDREPAKCFKAFLNNAWTGGFVFLGIALAYAF